MVAWLGGIASSVLSILLLAAIWQQLKTMIKLLIQTELSCVAHQTLYSTCCRVRMRRLAFGHFLNWRQLLSNAVMRLCHGELVCGYLHWKCLVNILMFSKHSHVYIEWLSTGFAIMQYIILYR